MPITKNANRGSVIQRKTPMKNIYPPKVSPASLNKQRSLDFGTTSQPIVHKPAKPSPITTKRKAEPSQGEPDKKSQGTEKRLKRYRDHAPQSFLEKLHRAQTQRMIVVARTRIDIDEHPEEDIDIVGSTGNIYRVRIGKVASCSCPDSKKGNECKHKVYALNTVLKAPENLVYQLAFLTTELQEIFAKAPPIPADVPTDGEKDGKRKPVEGECPICYMDFEEEHNELVWCKAACGNNMHKTCFDQWAASQRGEMVRCVYCRTPWEMDQAELDSIKSKGRVSADGYVNVAEQFGMSGARDYTSYYQPWVRSNVGIGS